MVEQKAAQLELKRVDFITPEPEFSCPLTSDTRMLTFIGVIGVSFIY